MRGEERNYMNICLGRIAAWVMACAFGFLVAVMPLASPTTSSAQVFVGISTTIAPPALPVYAQPPCPGPGYIWTPGYWAWDPTVGYYWVPGTWVLAPYPDELWTPGYWGWNNGLYVWNPGYWGPEVGFYGGIDYGCGYNGYGYEGGYWRHREFYYNRSVNNVSGTNITTVYSRPVGRAIGSRVSFNGGRGGITLRPTSAQMVAARQRHYPPSNLQRQHEQSARSDPRFSAALNHGRPPVAATQKPGVFSGHGVVPASRAGAPFKVQPNRPVHPGALAPTRPTRPAQKPAGIERHAPLTMPERSKSAARPAHPVSPPIETRRPSFQHNELRPAQPHPQMAPRPSVRPPVTTHLPPGGPAFHPPPRGPVAPPSPRGPAFHPPPAGPVAHPSPEGGPGHEERR